MFEECFNGDLESVSAIVNILSGMWEIVKLYHIIRSWNLCTLMGTCSSSLVLNSGTRLVVCGRSRCGTVDQSDSQRDIHMPMRKASASFSICAYLCSICVNDFEMNATGLYSSSWWLFCNKTAPSPKDEASAEMAV